MESVGQAVDVWNGKVVQWKSSTNSVEALFDLVNLVLYSKKTADIVQQNYRCQIYMSLVVPIVEFQLFGLHFQNWLKMVSNYLIKAYLFRNHDCLLKPKSVTNLTKDYLDKQWIIRLE